jgi:hypothetical protein
MNIALKIIALIFSLACNILVAQSLPLGAPSLDLQVVGKTVIAQWSSVPGATGYRLFHAPYPSQSPVSAIDMGMETSLFAELPADTAAYVAVAAYSQSGEGPISQVRNFRITENASQLPPPLMSYSVSGNTVTAQWSAVSGAAGYRLHVTPYPQMSPVQVIDVGNQTSISDTVPFGTAASISVAAYNSSSSSAHSDTQVVKVENSINKPALTTRSTGGGQGAIRPSGGQYSLGSIVSVLPSPHLYSYFHSWSNSSACAGGTVGCRLTMDGNKFMEARFEPIVWSYSGPIQEYQIFLNSSSISCTWAVSWSDIKIEINYRLQGSGSYLGYLTLTGRRKAVTNQSNCVPSDESISRSITFTPSGNSLNVRFIARAGVGNDYMTIKSGDLNSGSQQGTIASITMSYEGANRRGGSTLAPVFFSQTGAGRPRAF